MSRRVLVWCLAALVASGCGSSSMRVNRTPWPQSGRTTDTTTTPSASAPAATPAPPGSGGPTPSGEDVAIDMTPPADTLGSDPFDTTFVSPGRIEEVSEKDVLESLPPERSSGTTSGGARSTSTPQPPDRPAPAAEPSAGTASDAREPLFAPGRPASEPAAPSAPPGSASTSSGATSTAARDGAAVWVVQLYASPTRETAEFAARQIARQLGRSARVRELRPAAMPFKVIAGECAARACADTLRAEAVAHGYVDAWVTSVPPAEFRQLFEARPAR